MRGGVQALCAPCHSRLAGDANLRRWWDCLCAYSRNREDTITVTEWEAILESAGHGCVYCGFRPNPGYNGPCPSFRRLIVEHMLSPLRGGTHTADNMVPACQRCNSKKGDLTPAEWIFKQAGLLAQPGAGRSFRTLRAA